MPYLELENGNGRYHYAVQGQGEPVLLLHGFTGSIANWQYIIPVFANNYRVVAVDLPGHGKTVVPVDNIDYFSMAHTAKAIVSLLEELRLQSVRLLGYSMGGRLALYMATHFPEHIHSLVLESASPGLKAESERTARRQRDNELANKIETNGIGWFVDYWENLSLWDSQTSEQKTRLREQRLKNDTIGLANSLRGMGTGVMPSLWSKLSMLSMPVKLIVGESDTKFVNINQEMAGLIPNAHLSIVPGASHTVHLEAPDEFTQIVLVFWR